MNIRTSFYLSTCLFLLFCFMCLRLSASSREEEKISPKVIEALDSSPSGKTTVIVALVSPKAPSKGIFLSESARLIPFRTRFYPGSPKTISRLHLGGKI